MIAFPFDSQISGYDTSGYPIYDRASNAEQLAEWFRSYFTDGIFGDLGTKFQVLESSGMTVAVQPGNGTIRGRYFADTAVASLTVGAADANYPRVDTVVIRLDLSTAARSVILAIKAGTAASVPSAPTLTRDATVWEMALADIAVAANVTAITQANITDARLDSDRCGVVAQALTVLDTSTYYAQIAAALQQFQQTHLAAFNAWFATVQDTLDGDTAGNLLNLITANTALIGQSASPYVHTKTGTVHNFAGTGKLGFAKLTADYADGDTVTVNGGAVTVVGDLSDGVTDAAVLFSLNDAEMFVYAIASPFVVPDGGTASPVNDVQTWVECAGMRYDAIGSPSLATIIASESLCNTLMSSDNAVAYMIRSTTIQTAVLGSTTAITALDGSMPITSPNMTADSCLGWIASGTGLTSSESSSNAYRLFSLSTMMSIVGNATSTTIQIKAPEPFWLYKITADYMGAGWAAGSPSPSITISTSADGVTWSTIYTTSAWTETGESTTSQRLVMGVPSTEKIQYVRFAMVSNYFRQGRRVFIYGK